MVACAKFAHAHSAQAPSPHNNFHLRLPETVDVAVGHGMKGAGLGQCDDCLEDGRREEVGAVGAEFGAGEFNWQLRTVRNEIERRPGNVVLKRVRVRDFLPNGHLDLYGVWGNVE